MTYSNKYSTTYVSDFKFPHKYKYSFCTIFVHFHTNKNTVLHHLHPHKYKQFCTIFIRFHTNINSFVSSSSIFRQIEIQFCSIFIHFHTNRNTILLHLHPFPHKYKYSFAPSSAASIYIEIQFCTNFIRFHRNINFLNLETIQSNIKPPPKVHYVFCFW